MNASIRVQILFVSLMAISQFTMAGDGRNTTAINYKLILSAKEFYEEASVSFAPRICACQLLKVQSSGDQYQNVAIFAERVDNGDRSKGFSVATARLNKEKKNVRLVFADKVTYGEQVQAPTDCATMYKRLRDVKGQLTLFEVLNADIVMGK